mgnify:CR=1 FL=1
MNQKGNALFLILIAVALFAALSYAITQSGRGGAGIDKEKATLAAAQLMQYGGDLQIALQRMRVVGNVDIEQLDFRTAQRLENDGDDYPAYANTLCTTDDCQVFNNSGGGVAYISFEAFAAPPAGYGADVIAPGHSLFYIAQVDGIGTDAPEIMLRIPALDRVVCQEVNAKVGLPAAPTFSLAGETEYQMQGTPTAGLASSDSWVFGDDNDDLDGAYAFCIETATGQWDFFHVLVIR